MENEPKEEEPTAMEEPFSVSPAVALILATILFLVGRLACYNTIDKVVSYALSGIMVIGLLSDLVVNKLAALGIVLIANWSFPQIPPGYQHEEPKDEQ